MAMAGRTNSGSISGLQRKSYVDTLFEAANYLIMCFVLVMTLYPFVNILAISLNDPGIISAGSVYLLPKAFSLESYYRIFESDALLAAAYVTVMRTLIGTAASVFCCAMLAYVLSRKNLSGQKFYFIYFIFTMLFSGGLIPTYMVLRMLHLTNKFAVYIIPGLISMSAVLLIMMFFREIPSDMEESAKIDGSNDFSIFLRIYIPLSLPCIATIALFSAVGHWNSWFDSMIFTTKRELQVLQLILQKIITQSQTSALEEAKSTGNFQRTVSPETVKAAITIVTSLPIVLAYPFLQKYFVKGLIIGAIKG